MTDLDQATVEDAVEGAGETFGAAPRYLDRRVEALVPVGDPMLQARLQEVLDLNLSDDSLAWQLAPDGHWHKVHTGEGVDAQHRLQQIAFERGRRPTESAVAHGH